MPTREEAQCVELYSTCHFSAKYRVFLEIYINIGAANRFVVIKKKDHYILLLTAKPFRFYTNITSSIHTQIV
jgi:hypothetical protein